MQTLATFGDSGLYPAVAMLMDTFAVMSPDFVLEIWDSDEELPKLQVEFADYQKQCEWPCLFHQLSRRQALYDKPIAAAICTSLHVASFLCSQLQGLWWAIRYVSSSRSPAATT
jgi:hypothetical protein